MLPHLAHSTRFSELHFEFESTSQEGSQEDPVAVSLLKRPTMLYLSRSHVRFKPLYALLQRALKEKKIVTVGTLPGDMEVEDVRIIGDE